MHVPAKVSVMSLTIVGLAFLPPPHQDECFTWRLDSSAEMSDGSASIRLTDRPTTSIGWNVAVLTGPLLGVSAERNAKWRNSEGDSNSHHVAQLIHARFVCLRQDDLRHERHRDSRVD